MTTSVSETIMVALIGVLQAADPAAGRNTPLPDLGAIGTVVATVVRLLDATPQETEAFLNGGPYEFTVTPTVQVIGLGGADDAARDQAVAEKVEVLTAAIRAANTLPDAVTDVRPQPASGTPRELFGAPGIKAAEFGIEIDYWAETTAG